MATFTLQDLINAGLPAISTNGEGIHAHTEFSRQLTPGEWMTYLGISNPDLATQLAAISTAQAIPNWATWTYDQFTTWCDNNLMTDAAIDGTTLSAALKTNIKALNAFVRNAGKMEITLRNWEWPGLVGE